MVNEIHNKYLNLNLISDSGPEIQFRDWLYAPSQMSFATVKVCMADL
jgi:hypothetical protein